MKEIANHLEMDIPVSVKPLARSVSDYKQKLNTCFLGGDKIALQIYLGLTDEQMKNFVFSSPYLKIDYVFYTLKTRKKISEKDQLKGKYIGITLGMNADHLDIKEYESSIVRVNSTSALMKMLEIGNQEEF